MSKSPSQPSSIKALEQLKSEALEQSKLQLQAYYAERSAQRRAQYAEDARIQDKFRDLMLGELRSNEVGLKQLAADQSRLIERRAKPIRPPLLPKGKRPMPRSLADTASVTRGPPYDGAYPPPPNGQGSAGADPNTGVYESRRSEYWERGPNDCCWDRLLVFFRRGGQSGAELHRCR